MDPLQPVAMPTHAVVVGLTAENSWLTDDGGSARYLAYIASDSTQQASFVSLNSNSGGAEVLSLAARSSYSPEYRYGVVLEVLLTRELPPGQAVHVTLAQAGATTYYPPQPIQD